MSFTFWGAEIPWNSERTVEYPWVEAHLIPPPASILDVGCGYSALARLLVKKGYEAYGIDINEDWIPKVAGFKGSRQDIRRTSFPDEFFDQILFVSTLEHIGMDWYYNKWLDVEQGDFEAMREAHRILRQEGSILITVPYGNFHIYRALRVYSDGRIERFFQGFKIKVADWFVRKEGKMGRWCSATQSEAFKIDCPNEDNISAIICLEAVKVGCHRSL